ncbi:MAG TPA: tRNA pseudouridine(38-40) synthase TruA, partial [Steroidobacteraceae bacterium]|nr:tRNA pseudouridine(38-40) synthase TruA [Steroidobacteraceae bacterium]
MLVEYDGTRFAGFQRQAPDKGPTVQGALEAALARVAGVAVGIEAAGRTDAGVHAAAQVVSFAPVGRLDAPTWGRATNAYLPGDVSIRAAAAVEDTFHARYSALSRSYRYRLFCDPVPAPLRERYALRVPQPLDVAAMDAGAARLVGEHDFGAFGASPHGAGAHTRRVMLAARCRRVARGAADDARDGDDEVACEFTANAFLTGMVRRLVGALLLVGEGRLTEDEFAAILAAGVPEHPGAAVAARGLCLVGVSYPPGA